MQKQKKKYSLWLLCTVLLAFVLQTVHISNHMIYDVLSDRHTCDIEGSSHHHQQESDECDACDFLFSYVQIPSPICCDFYLDFICLPYLTEEPLPAVIQIPLYFSLRAPPSYI